MRTFRSRISTLFVAAALGGVLLSSPLASAGDLKFGEGVGSLDIDDDGKLTADGRKAATTKLDKIPGEDAWDLNLWASLDSKRAEGPLYVEFYQRVQGKDSIVHRHDEDDYDGRKYLLTNILLEGNVGFNKDRTYTVKVIQVDERGRNILLAKGSIELINTGRTVEDDDDMGADEGGGEDEGDSVSQDELDSLAGPDDEMDDDSAPDEAPPPVEPAKKGCSVDGGGDFSGLAVLLLAGLFLRRRDEARRSPTR